jgi:hypothetical protein
MQVRTLAQHVLLGYAVGVGLAVSRMGPEPPVALKFILLMAGSILAVFGSVLWLLNQHHSIAFRAIRDKVLVPLEENHGAWQPGPWTAQQTCREIDHPQNRRWAWHAPFVALIGVGVVTITIGGLLFR